MRRLVALLYCLTALAARPFHRCRLRNWNMVERDAKGAAFWHCVSCGRRRELRATWADRAPGWPSQNARALLSLIEIERATQAAEQQAITERERAKALVENACRRAAGLAEREVA